jgi:hypothetical protein
MHHKNVSRQKMNAALFGIAMTALGVASFLLLVFFYPDDGPGSSSEIVLTILMTAAFLPILPLSVIGMHDDSNIFAVISLIVLPYVWGCAFYWFMRARTRRKQAQANSTR